MAMTLGMRTCFVMFVVAIAACAPLTQLQDTAAKFDQGVHVAVVAETNLFHQVRAAECTRNFYRQGFDFATAIPDARHKYTKEQSELDLDPTHCVPLELTDEQLAIRLKLLDLIALYADAIQALTNGTSEKSLNDNSQSLAASIKEMGKQQKFSAPAAGGAAALNTAVVLIVSAIVDRKIFADVQKAAAAVHEPLSTVIGALKAENSADAIGLAGKTDSLINEMRSALSASRDKNGPVSFIDVAAARATLQSAVVTAPNVDLLNQTLDSVLRANDALARSGNGGAMPQIAELSSRAQQAAGIFNASK